MTDSTVPPPAPALLRTDSGQIARIGGLGGLALLAGLTLWAQLTPISGAVIAPGQVVVRGQPKLVQSFDGGVVETISVANGDTVRAGQVLMRLDPTLLQVNLDTARSRLAEALARRARLEAEQLGRASIEEPALPAYVGALPLGPQLAGQAQIFQARADVLRGRKDQLTETLAQVDSQITGVEALIGSKRDQLGFIERELVNIRALNEQGLARESQMLDLQGRQADMLGQIASHQAELAQLRTSTRDTALAILQAEREFREEVVTELREVTLLAEELVLQIITTTRQIDRVDLRAPADGVVHELQVTTLGGVVAPGATVLQIVPLAQGIEFELRVDPRAIDQVEPGQRAKIMLPGFNPRTTPDLHGTVTTIAPGAVTDPATGQPFFRVGLAIPPDQLGRLGARPLVPGMPVDAFLETPARPALSYLLQPLNDHLLRAFREE